MHNPWLRLGFDTWSLGIEASAVIGLRAMKLATGTASADETARMVGEKVEAAIALQMRALTGDVGPATTIAHYRRKVRANRLRLSR